MTTSITLSRRQAKEADRVGGIELLLLWPVDLLGPPPANLALDHEREATAREKSVAEALVRASCDANGLLPVHVRVARVIRPKPPPARPQAGEDAYHLAVTIIGHRWVHASTRSRGKTMFA